MGSHFSSCRAKPPSFKNFGIHFFTVLFCRAKSSKRYNMPQALKNKRLRLSITGIAGKKFWQMSKTKITFKSTNRASFSSLPDVSVIGGLNQICYDIPKILD